MLLGLIIGFFAGGVVGALCMALVAASGRSNRQREDSSRGEKEDKEET